jgi:hypothetical protein
MLDTLEGFPLNGLFHSRCLWRFIPHDGTVLAELQAVLGDMSGDNEAEINRPWEDDLQEVEELEE